MSMKNAFMFMKLENKLKKSEIFILGYIFGSRDSALQLAQNTHKLTDEQIDELDEDVFTPEALEDAWNRIAAEMQITDARSYFDVMEILEKAK